MNAACVCAAFGASSVRKNSVRGMSPCFATVNAPAGVARAAGHRGAVRAGELDEVELLGARAQVHRGPVLEEGLHFDGCVEGPRVGRYELQHRPRHGGGGRVAEALHFVVVERHVPRGVGYVEAEHPGQECECTPLGWVGDLRLTCELAMRLSGIACCNIGYRCNRRIFVVCCRLEVIYGTCDI